MGMKIIKGLFFPFAIIYDLIVMIRNILFDSGVLKEHQILKPSIGVGESFFRWNGQVSCG